MTANESLSKINLSVNQEYGYLTFSLGKLLSLPPIIMKKVLQVLTAHMGGSYQMNHNITFKHFHTKVLSQNKKTAKFENCIVFFSELENDTITMGKAPPSPQKQIWARISVGQTIRWDRRWRITLKPLEKLDRNDSDEIAPDRVIQNEQLFFVRYTHMSECLGRKQGDFPPYIGLLLRLPVVCTETGDVVVAPHFKKIDPSYGVDCDVVFDPLLPLIQDSDTQILY